MQVLTLNIQGNCFRDSKGRKDEKRISLFSNSQEYQNNEKWKDVGLPEDKHSEILDFIEFLSKKVNEEKRKQQSKFSLESAMRRLKTEESLYSLNDIKEKC